MRRVSCPIIAFLSMASAGFASLDGEAMAITSTVHNGYERRQENGHFPPETYTFAEGASAASSVNDFTLNRLKFVDVARLIAPALRKQNYLPGFDAGKLDLLIIVYWGRTSGSADQADMKAFTDYKQAIVTAHTSTTPTTGNPFTPGNRGGDVPTDERAKPDAMAMDGALTLVEMQNRARDRIDGRNARILGYSEELTRTDQPVLDSRHRDLESEVAEDRYYVVLMAYDYSLLAKEKKSKLLWTTRMSLAAKGSAFDESMPELARVASRYFGRASEGLRHEILREGKVEAGETKVIEEIPRR